VAEVPFEVALVELAEPPVYQQIARKALHLYQLGLTHSQIARRLRVSNKTAAKAIKWSRQE